MKNKKALIIASIVLIVCVFTAVVFTTTRGISSTSAAKLLELGNKYLLEENYEEAILAFNKAIEIEPKNIDARLGLAEVYRKSGDLNNEEIQLKEILDIKPSNIDTIILLADLYIEQGKETEARTLLEDAIAKTSDQQARDKLQKMLDGLMAEADESKTDNESEQEIITNILTDEQLIFLLPLEQALFTCDIDTAFPILESPLFHEICKSAPEDQNYKSRTGNEAYTYIYKTDNNGSFTIKYLPNQEVHVSVVDDDDKIYYRESFMIDYNENFSYDSTKSYWSYHAEYAPNDVELSHIAFMEVVEIAPSTDEDTWIGSQRESVLVYNTENGLEVAHSLDDKYTTYSWGK